MLGNWGRGMEILESAMAFAVAMIIFSTVATGIVELIVRLFAFRERVLKKTLESLFETVIQPRLDKKLAELKARGAANADQDDKQVFIQRMTGNPAYADWRETPKRWWWPPRIMHAGGIDALTTIAFAERLARTDIGKAIVEEARMEADALVTDFCRTFERFGRASSEVFRKWTHVTSIVVGVVLAFAVNIDAGRLLTTMIRDPDLRANLIAQAESASAANVAAVASLQAVRELEEKDLLKEDQVRVIREKSAALLAEVASAREVGLPIGWGYFPYCGRTADATGTDAYPDCDAWKGLESWSAAGEFGRWLILTLVAGVLIGLGGPFWFRVFSSLSQVAQMLRSLGVGGGKATRAEDAPKAAATETTAQPETVLDAFRVAAEAHAKSSG